MKHPTPDELSAFHDGVLGASELVVVERHVNECAACRDALEALERQDRALAATLTHDPGDAHFDALAARIERDLAAYAPGRSAAGAAGEARGRASAGGAAGAGGAAWRWLAGAAVAARERLFAIVAAARERLVALLGGARRMRAPSWAGAAMALVVAVGLLLFNLERAPSLRDPAIERRVGQAADQARGGRDDDPPMSSRDAPAPAEKEASSARSRAAAPRAGTPEPKGRAAAPSTGANARADRALAAAPSTGAKSPATGSAQGVAPARAYEVKRTAAGEDVRVRKQEGAFAKAPPPPAQAEGGRTVPLKPQFAQPLEQSKPRADAKESASAPAEGTSSALANESTFAFAKDESSARKVDTRALALDATAGSRTGPAPAPAPAGSTPARESRAAAPSASAAGARDEAPRAGAAATQAPPSAPEPSAVSGDPPVVRRCGVVKDSFGRPIPSASVTIATRGSGATADAQGRFCIESSAGDHTVSVFAVGFDPLHLEVRMASGAEPLVITLHAVPVIQDATARAGMLKALGGVPQTGSPEDGLRAFPDSLQPVAARAVRITLAAERAKSAPQFDAAAVEWERVRERAAGQPLELEARFRVAEARYRAWELAPTERRASLAHEALTSFLVRAPLGAQRDRATAWLGKVK